MWDNWFCQNVAQYNSNQIMESLKWHWYVQIRSWWYNNTPTNGGPPWHGGGAYGLQGSCRFRFLGIQRGGDYFESPSLALRTRLMGLLKSPRTPFRACVRRAFWRYHYLRAFSGVDTRAPGIISMYLCHLCRLRPFESHTSGGGLSSYGSSQGPFPQSHPRRVRKLWARLEKYARLLARTFFSLNV